MSDRSRTLILELLLLSARYSQREIQEARALLSANKFVENLNSIFELDEELKKRLQTARPKEPTSLKKRASSKLVVSPKNQFLQRISDRKKMTAGSLRTIAGVLGLNPANISRDDLIRSIKNSVADLDSDQFDQFLSDISSRSADSNYLRLAEFILREEK